LDHLDDGPAPGDSNVDTPGPHPQLAQLRPDGGSEVVAQRQLEGAEDPDVAEAPPDDDAGDAVFLESQAGDVAHAGPPVSGVGPAPLSIHCQERSIELRADRAWADPWGRWTRARRIRRPWPGTSPVASMRNDVDRNVSGTAGRRRAGGRVTRS